MSSKKLTKKVDPDTILNVLRSPPSAGAAEFIKDMCPKLDKYYAAKAKGGSKAALAEMQEEANDLIRSATRLLTLDNHTVASESVGPDYRPVVTEVAMQLVSEYEAKSPSERALAGMIASAYGRYMEYTKAFNVSQRIEFLSAEQNAYYRNFSVEADKAFRQFQSGLAMLRQMKSPTVNVTVKAGTAFVAQNQQVNANMKATNHKKEDI